MVEAANTPSSGESDPPAAISGPHMLWRPVIAVHKRTNWMEMSKDHNRRTTQNQLHNSNRPAAVRQQRNRLVQESRGSPHVSTHVERNATTHMGKNKCGISEITEI